MRVLFCSLAVLALCAGGLVAADKEKDTKAKVDTKKEKKARIVKIDAKKGTVTVRMRNELGKEVTRTFTLAEDIRYFDSTGRAVAVDVFTSGDYVLIVEREGKLTQLKKRERKGPAKGPVKKPAGS